MTSSRRSKRKATQAALDITKKTRVAEEEEEEEEVAHTAHDCLFKRLGLHLEKIGPKLYEYILQYSQDLQLSSFIVHGHSPVRLVTVQVRQQLAAKLQTLELHCYS